MSNRIVSKAERTIKGKKSSIQQQKINKIQLHVKTWVTLTHNDE